MNILAMFIMENFHSLNINMNNIKNVLRAINSNIKNVINNIINNVKKIINFLYYLFDLLKKGTLIATLKEKKKYYITKLKNLSEEDKWELICEIRYRILFHGFTFLVFYSIFDALIDYLDQFF